MLNSGNVKEGLIFSYHLESMIPMYTESGCQLKMRNATTGEKYELTLKAGDGSAFLDTSPGLYALQELYCTQNWRTNLITANWLFHIYPEKISYITPLSFTLNTNNFMIYFGAVTKEMQQKDLTSWFAKLPESVAKRIVSGNNAIPITQEMASELFLPRIRIRSEVAGDLIEKDVGSPNIDKCFQKMERGAAIAGQLTLRSKYQNKEMVEFKIGTAPHTYPATFIECLKAEFTHFHPKKYNNIEITLEL